MAGFEGTGDIETAGSIAAEIVRLEPKSIRFQKKRVEFAFRVGDREKLAEAYIELADALLADGQASPARAVYQRVLEIRPDDLRAQAAIESIPEETAPAAPAPRRPCRRALGSTYGGASKPPVTSPHGPASGPGLKPWQRSFCAPALPSLRWASWWSPASC